MIGLGAVAVVAIVVAVVVATGAFRNPPQPAPLTVDDILAALDRQSAALVRGDEAGWLAPVRRGNVDLVDRYRGLYRNLRAFGVTSFKAAAADDALNALRKNPRQSPTW